MVFEELHILDQREAKTAGADEAENRRRANADVKTIDRVADELWNDLRRDSEQDHLHARRAGGELRFDLPLIDSLDLFRAELRQHTSRVQRDRKDAGEWPETDGAYEDESEHQLVDSAQRIQQ